MEDFLGIKVSSSVKKAFTTLYDQWQDVRDGDAIPRKSDINPMKISSILPEIAIMERIDQDTVVFRLAGTRLVERAGFDLTNSNTLETFPEAARHIMSSAYEKSAAKPCAVKSDVAVYHERKTSYKIDCLYLPLSNDDGIAQYHITLMFVEDKKGYEVAALNKVIGFEVPSIRYLDIGHGTLESEDVPSHMANLTNLE